VDVESDLTQVLHIRRQSHILMPGSSSTTHYHIMNTPSKVCRNCGGTEFFAGDTARTVTVTLFALPPKFHLRVCGTCGLVDWFLTGKDLQKLKKKFSPESA
jgi:predicted nucleic-acid-binding Zn-ribbon protein